MDPALVENLHKMERTRRLEVIYNAYYEKVYRSAVRYGAGNTAWAEDITQEVFMKLVKNLDSLHEGVDPGPWLARVTANTCLTKLKRQHFWDHKIPKWIFRDAQTMHVTPERVADARDSVRKAHALVQSLPPKERMAFLMHRVEHMTMDEIGEQLGHSKGYISKLISRAQSKLRAAQWSNDD
ncbi:MAG: sigma-70 family RNA polymerase sigma factor [Myxococcota bacterium]